MAVVAQKYSRIKRLVKTMSPSKWKWKGSCLPLLCSLVQILANKYFASDYKIQYAAKMNTHSLTQEILLAFWKLSKNKGTPKQSLCQRLIFCPLETVVNISRLTFWNL